MVRLPPGTVDWDEDPQSAAKLLAGPGYKKVRVEGLGGHPARCQFADGDRLIDRQRMAENKTEEGAVKTLDYLSTGRRPLLAAGNSNGDIAMLDFSQHADKPSLRLLVLHDDADREFNYTTGAEQALDHADDHHWTVASIKNDWATVF